MSWAEAIFGCVVVAGVVLVWGFIEGGIKININVGSKRNGGE